MVSKELEHETLHLTSDLRSEQVNETGSMGNLSRRVFFDMFVVKRVRTREIRPGSSKNCDEGACTKTLHEDDVFKRGESQELRPG